MRALLVVRLQKVIAKALNLNIDLSAKASFSDTKY